MEMKMNNNPFGILLMLMVVLSLASCGQSEKETKETDNTEVQARGKEESSSGHDHHAAVALSTEETTVWKPSGEGADLIGRDFHFIEGSIDQISPKVMSEGAEEVLQLTTSEEQSAFVFHNKMGNVGIAVTLQRGDYQGAIKIIHHAQNAQTYEYVSINNDTMIQGRVIDGVEEVFDTKNFDTENEDWMTIRVSAAGTHFKGYLGDKNITHGHGDEMEAGYVGVMLEGIGSVVIKSMEVTPLEAEQNIFFCKHLFADFNLPKREVGALQPMVGFVPGGAEQSAPFFSLMLSGYIVIEIQESKDT